MDRSWFSDVWFLGDSLTQGMQMYENGLPNAHFCAYKGVGPNAVVNGEADCGILVCGTGIGMAIAANKVHGIRCAVCNDPYSATMAHEHNDANVIAVGARVVGIEVLKSIFRNYLAARYNEKYNARLAMIAEIEREGK